MTVKGAPLSLVRGQEAIYNLTLVDDTGTAINLTGQTVTFAIASQVDPTAPLVTKDSGTTGGVVINSPSAGTITVTLQVQDTATLSSAPYPGTAYFYDVWLDNGLGNQRPALSYGSLMVVARVANLGSPAPVILNSGTQRIAAGATAEVTIANPSGSQVPWMAAIGTDHSSGVQVAPNGSEIPGASGGIAIVQETSNNGQPRFMATNLGASALSILWKVLAQSTGLATGTVTLPPGTGAGDTGRLLTVDGSGNPLPITLDSLSALYVGAVLTDTAPGYRLAVGGALGTGVGVGLVLEETAVAGQVHVRAINRDQFNAHTIRWGAFRMASTATATLGSGASALLNQSPIVPGAGNVLFVGAIGTDAVAGVQIALGGNTIIGSDGISIVVEETGTAGEVNLRATNLGSNTRAVRWGYLVA